MDSEDKTVLNSDRACIISLTKQGNNLAQKITKLFKTKQGRIDCYTLKKFAKSGFYSFEDLDQCFKTAFNNYDTIIAIMAIGIVVRKIQPLLVSKVKDPGIIVMDVNGNNIISLLSGHIGKANENTLILSNSLKSNPVITTASDNLGITSVDLLAQELNLKIVDFEKAKQITSLMVEGKTIFIYSDYLFPNKNYSNFRINPLKSLPPEKDGYIIISELNNLESTNKLGIQLYPKVITIGIGSKKGISGKLIIKKINTLLEKHNLNKNSIESFATIINKRNEVGILEAVDYFNSELKIIDKELILPIEKKFNFSSFTKKTVGVGSVSEACGYVSSFQGQQIGQTIKEDGVTISIWKRNTL